jgi:ferredoxin
MKLIVLLLVALSFEACNAFSIQGRGNGQQVSQKIHRPPMRLRSSNDEEQEGIETSLDDRLYKVRIARAPGIEWGTDLSFSFVYVRGVDPSGPAAQAGIQKGDQLCELTPVAKDASPVNLLGASFDFVMSAFAQLERNVIELDLVFFRGTKDELKAVCSGGTDAASSETVTVTVIENKGSPDETVHKLVTQPGTNVRSLLTDNGINVYQSFTRWTNCKGKQLCGTCIVNVVDGSVNTNRKSMDEASTLRENPDSYRLSCVSFAYGDITVETFPPVKASQWTR